jgi:N-terminal acetyltransferase B complex non-catalytic subunit
MKEKRYVDYILCAIPRNQLETCWSLTCSPVCLCRTKQSQREARPGDELILLLVQQLLYQESSSTEALVTGAVLLETAINHSPHNAYLQIAAIDVYYHLNAMSRSWELFQAIGLKHIQLDSCTYTILPLLVAGGLYNETIEVCNALLRFQAGTARDCSEYAGRAMEAGTLSKANEFLVFQRDKMNKSVAVLQAKGLILDSAPLLANVVARKKHDDDPILEGGLGIHQGIVGGDGDMGRAIQMVVEAHNPYAALSVVSWADSDGSSIDDGKDMADNRDLSILSQQILYQSKVESKQDIVQDALRRGHIHGLLIRSTLCVDATKGPKKGKIVKSSDELEKRISSLLDCVKACTEFVEKHTLAEGRGGECCKALMRATMDLCRTLAIVSAGLPTLENDSLEEREKLAAELLQQVTNQLKQAKEHLALSSVKDVCFLLPNYVVPLFALFRMCSNTLALFGWSKRKITTKICAGAMADLALAFAGIVQQLQSCVER